MHGRPRQHGPLDPERAKAQEKKARLLGQLLGEVLRRRAADDRSPESLALCGKLLELNPEVYTAWNYRRECLKDAFDAGGSAAIAAAKGELELTQKAVLRNPKSYCAWHHRKWVVAKRLTSLEAEISIVESLLDVDDRNFHAWGYRVFVAQLMGLDLARELAYTERKIEQNFSNYSAWHYRTKLLPLQHPVLRVESSGGAAVADAGAVRPEIAAGAVEAAARGSPTGAERAAAAAAAASSRSEAGAAGLGDDAGSAALRDSPVDALAEDLLAASLAERGGGDDEAHLPPAALPPTLASTAPPSLSAELAAPSAPSFLPPDVLREELELVRQALFTEPGDSSGWVYHRWLLACAAEGWRREVAGGSAGASSSSPLSSGQARSLRETLDDEGSCLDEILELDPSARQARLARVRISALRAELDAWEGGRAGARAELPPDARAAVEALVEADPFRRGMYADLLAGKARVA